MIKYLLVFFNLAGLLFFRTFFDAGIVTVSHNFPTAVTIGSEYVVEVKINKSELEGFAEFKQILPVGFSATVIDSKRGSFSFSDREVKIIWMTIPPEKEFIVKYKIIVLSNAVSGDWVDGSFSYLDNNQKATVTLEKKKIELGSSTPDAVAIIDSLNSKNATPALSLPVSCKRAVTYTGNSKQILVEVSIQNDSVSGFAKLEEVIPAGFIATSSDLHGAVFSYVDQKVKFLWMSFPFEKEFKVSYLLAPDESAADSSEINGFLSFTISEESKKFTLSPTLLNLKSVSAEKPVLANQPVENKIDSSAAVSKITTPSSDEKKQIVADNPVSENKAIQQEPQTIAQAAQQIQESSKSNSPLGKSNTVTSIPDPQSGVSFRVQICATHKIVEPSYFKESYKINEEIYAEMHEGWHKFTLNNVSTYKLARDKREELKQNQQIQGPFVTAYNSGTRITVQEALMISNQKWVR